MSYYLPFSLCNTIGANLEHLWLRHSCFGAGRFACIAGLFPTCPGDLQDGRAWPNYRADYSELVDTAAAAQARVIAANAPRRYVSLVGRHGVAALSRLPRADAACLPPDALLTPVSAALHRKISREFSNAQAPSERLRPATDKAGGGEPGRKATGRDAAVRNTAAPSQSTAAGEGECPYVGMRLSDNFLAAQGLWDSCMADSIITALRRNGDFGDSGSALDGGMHAESRAGIVFHVCGKFHMEEGLGICERLAERDPQLSVGTAVAMPVNLARVQQALAQRPLAQFTDGEVVPGMRCTVGTLRGIADFVVLTNSELPRSF